VTSTFAENPDGMSGFWTVRTFSPVLENFARYLLRPFITIGSGGGEEGC
jgi:hypothetical protein